MMKGAGPPSKPCFNCGAPLIWDGAIRATSGKYPPLTKDYRFHDCGDPTLTNAQVDQKAIDYISWRMNKFNEGLRTCKMKLVLVLEDGREIEVTSENHKKLGLVDKKGGLAPMQERLLNSLL